MDENTAFDCYSRRKGRGKTAAPGGRVRREDDEHQFRQRAVSCLDGLFGFAVSLCHDRTRAEDLVQEAYLRAFRAGRRPGPEENLRSWLFTILHNVWRNERRRRPAESFDANPELLGRLPSVGAWAERDLDAATAAEDLRSAIRELPEPYREAVMLRFSEGFSYQEIATILDCPAGTVMSRLARARALLRQAVSAPPARRLAGGRT
jgi:RNA polymerase sigma-70 factor, ECF subfamily